jgi:hypothetical protein
MKIAIHFLLPIILLLYNTVAYGQDEKREVEDSIKKSEMPATAVLTLDEFWPDKDDIRYFSETDGDTETFEAKLEWQGKQYSIEFTKAGNIIDVEQLVEITEISESAGEAINNYLEQQFDRVRITRLQRQFLADDDDESDDIDFIDDILEEDDDDYDIRYELEVEGKSGSEIGAFELLFNKDGDLIQQRRIIRRSLDNIW